MGVGKAFLNPFLQLYGSSQEAVLHGQFNGHRLAQVFKSLKCLGWNCRFGELKCPSNPKACVRGVHRMWCLPVLLHEQEC